MNELEIKQLEEDHYREVKNELQKFKAEFPWTPEGREMCIEKINELRDLRVEEARRMTQIIHNLATVPKRDAWIYELSKELSDENLKKIDRQINKFRMLLQEKDWVAVGQRKFEVEKVKEIPIGDIMPTPPILNTSERATYLCPLHNEKTASFVWFKKKNNYHCFGCHENGDIIDLYQKMNNCNFVQACQVLVNL